VLRQNLAHLWNQSINPPPTSNHPVRFCHDRAASTLCRLAHRSFSVPRRPHFGEPRASSATADSPCQATVRRAASPAVFTDEITVKRWPATSRSVRIPEILASRNSFSSAECSSTGSEAEWLWISTTCCRGPFIATTVVFGQTASSWVKRKVCGDCGRCRAANRSGRPM